MALSCNAVVFPWNAECHVQILRRSFWSPWAWNSNCTTTQFYGALDRREPRIRRTYRCISSFWRAASCYRIRPPIHLRLRVFRLGVWPDCGQEQPDCEQEQPALSACAAAVACVFPPFAESVAGAVAPFVESSLGWPSVALAADGPAPGFAEAWRALAAVGR